MKPCSRLFVNIILITWLVNPSLPGRFSLAASWTHICEIQGKGASSPYEGKWVTTRGIVFADQDNASMRGFYIQESNCDTNPNTSDGIFVYLGEKIDVVSLGDRVEVQGLVAEYYGKTELQAAPEKVKRLSSANPLPAVTDLVPPYDKEAARSYFETLESMHVGIQEVITVGPTDNSGRSWVVQANLGISRVFQDDVRGTGEVICLEDDGDYQVEPQVKVGDHIQELRGALDYQVGEYCLQLFKAPLVIPVNVPGISTNGYKNLAQNSFRVRLASFNLSNLFDTTDDPEKNDTVLSAAEYQRRLQKRALVLHDSLLEPELIAVQEVENETVLKALVGRPELVQAYGYIWEDGPDNRGLDLAVLYRKDRIQVFGYQVRQGCTTLVDGLGPDGNDDVHNPQNTITCDTNSDGILDGNRLFSRPPLIVHAYVYSETALGSNFQNQGTELWLIANHFKSKIEDSASQAYTLPRRIEEANFVSSLVHEIRTNTPGANIVVLGDLNDFPTSQPLEILQQAGLINTLMGVPYSQRYTYIFQGISQVLDHILVDLTLPLACISVVTYPINSDFPVVYAGVNDTVYRSSDHDPVSIELTFLENKTFLPITLR